MDRIVTWHSLQVSRKWARHLSNLRLPLHAPPTVLLCMPLLCMHHQLWLLCIPLLCMHHQLWLLCIPLLCMHHQLWLLYMPLLCMYHQLCWQLCCCGLLTGISALADACIIHYTLTKIILSVLFWSLIAVTVYQ